MTDEERYPPPYEDAALAEYRRTHLPARQRLRDGGLELHRHYVGSTACLPSRATLFTGQYPSLHGVTNTDGMAKSASDPTMTLARPRHRPDHGRLVPGRGLPHALPGQVAHLPRRPAHARARTRPRRPTIVTARSSTTSSTPTAGPTGSTRSASAGWIGREPHGADPADTGIVRDPIFAEQVAQLFAELADDRDDGPWLTVASLVNPHDIAFSGFGWEVLGFPPTPDSVPDVAAAPSQDDSLDDRPTAQAAVPRRLAPHALRPADRPRVPPLLLLAARAGRRRDRPHPRRARRVGPGRRHHRGVHVRPRRPARRPRRAAAEVAQRLRRGAAGAVRGARSGRRRAVAAGIDVPDEPRRPAAHRCSASSAPTSSSWRRAWPSTTSRRTRSSGAISAG